MSKKTFNDTVDELFEDLALPDDNEIRKETGYAKSSGSKTGQKRSTEQKANMSAWQKGTAKKEAHKEKISNSLIGKTLEEILGDKDRAEAGIIKRRQSLKSQHASGVRKTAYEKTRATRKANGSYGTSMLDKEHKDSTKEIMSIKAKIRQELKRKLKLGKSDSIPKDILKKAYKKQGLE
jgi:hypothetical protein